MRKDTKFLFPSSEITSSFMELSLFTLTTILTFTGVSSEADSTSNTTSPSTVFSLWSNEDSIPANICKYPLLCFIWAGIDFDVGKTVLYGNTVIAFSILLEVIRMGRDKPIATGDWRGTDSSKPYEDKNGIVK